MNESAKQVLPGRHLAEHVLQAVGELVRISGCPVRERIQLEVAPEELDGIEFGRVGRKELEPDMPPAADAFPDGAAAVDGEARLSPSPAESPGPVRSSAGFERFHRVDDTGEE